MPPNDYTSPIESAKILRELSNQQTVLLADPAGVVAAEIRQAITIIVYRYPSDEQEAIERLERLADALGGPTTPKEPQR